MALPTDLPGNTPADGRAVLLITTVDIGGGKSEKIELRAGDDPADAAREFCDKHSLPPTIMGPLTMHILENLRKAAEKASNAAKQAGSTTSETKGQQSSVKSPTQAESLPSAKQEKLTFANGMNDKLYEQLSAKLLDVDEGSRMVTVTANTNGRPLSSRQQGGGSTLASSVGLSADLRKASSAGPSPRDAVHNRLYNYATTVRNKQEAKRRAAKDEMAASMTLPRSSMSWISQEMMRDRTHGPFDNYGEMLYAEGLEAAAVQRSKASMVRAEREARELDGVTFAPEITQLAKTLWSGGDLDAQPAWQRLSINKQAKMMERIRDLQKQREDGEMRQCTFKPKINRHSANLMSERSEALKVLQVSAHDQLFQDAQRRQAKLSELQSWLPDDVTFAPQINRTGTAAAHLRHSLDALGLQKRAEGGAGDGSPGTADVRASVVDRLYMNYEKTKAKLEGKREQLNGPVDPVTGRQLYKPAVGRGPRNVARNQEGLSIGEYLYTNGMELVSKKEMALEEEREAERAAANLRHANSTSEKLYAQLRAKRFSQIFEYLDEAGDGMLDVVGLVRAATARMDNLDNEVREDVELAAEIHARASGVPLLPDGLDVPSMVAGSIAALSQEQLAGLPKAPSVSLAAFTQLMDEALSRRRKPRAYLVPSPSAKYQPTHTFQPTINKRSKGLATQLRPGEIPVYELLHHHSEAIRSKHEALRRQLEEASMTGCTFAPKLNAPVLQGRPVEGRALRAAGAPTPPLSSHTSAMGSVTSPHATPKRSPAPVGSAPAAPSGSASAEAADLQAFLALEREVHQALAGMNLPTDGEARPQEDGADAAAEQAAHALQDVDPADLRATEELLLNLLSTSDSNDPAADALMLDQLKTYLQATQTAAGPSHPGTPQTAAWEGGATPGQQQHNTTCSPGRLSRFGRSSGEADPHASTLEELASSLSQWDHLTTPV